jgi:hypothetical protein
MTAETVKNLRKTDNSPRPQSDHTQQLFPAAERECRKLANSGKSLLANRGKITG